MVSLLLLLAGCSDGDGGCSSAYGPEGVSVEFTVTEEGDYAWTIVGDEVARACTATVPGDVVDCDASSYGFTGPEAADGGGWTFGSFLTTSDEGDLHVTLALDDASLLDTEAAPDWEPVTSEGVCADHLKGKLQFDLREEGGR